MGMSKKILKFSFLAILLKCLDAQERFDAPFEVNDPYFKQNGHLTDIPKTFEVKGENAKSEFKKFAEDIQALSMGKNMSVMYKVNVVLQKATKKKHKVKKMFKNIRSKKYNVPLKKQSMRLSNFEVLMRKLSEESNPKPQEIEKVQYTTKNPTKVFTTKLIKLKYKPILSKVKNFTKIIKPVRTKIITLDSYKHRGTVRSLTNIF